MNKTIRETSTRLLGLLPPDVLHYSLDDLRRFGMPEFIIRRIQLDLVDVLTQSIGAPSTEWVDMSRHRSVVAWNHFVETISADVHLPRNRAADVIDHAVIETVEIITTPRRRIIEVLFGMSQEIQLNELRSRSRGITVHRHIPESLLRYMERKEMHSLTRAAAIELVRKVDDRYSATFTPLSWAQSLDPLYQLAGSRVDADLIRDYFIDKDLEHYAVRFENLPHRVERSQLIEILSISDLDNLILDDDRKVATIKPVENVEPIVQIPTDTTTSANESPPLQPSLFESLSEIHAHDKNGYESESSKVRPKKVPTPQLETNLNSGFEEASLNTDSADATRTESLLNSIQHESIPELESPFDDALAVKMIVEDEIASEIINENEYLLETEKETESSFENDDDTENLILGAPIKPNVPRIIDMLVQPESSVEHDVSDDETAFESSSESTLNERLTSASVIPIWQRFLDDVPEVSDDVDEQKANIDDPEPATVTDMPVDTDAIDLSEWLKPDEKDYIETLFDGDKAAYTKAIDDLSMYQSWSQAQNYLKKKLMPVVAVEYHDELFINFVDQLQHYFSRLPLD